MSEQSIHLSKACLKSATILSQVDSKYLLVKMRSMLGERYGGQVLVCIDQHAADERYRYELLLQLYSTTSGHLLNKAIKFHQIIDNPVTARKALQRLSFWGFELKVCEERSKNSVEVLRAPAIVLQLPNVNAVLEQIIHEQLLIPQRAGIIKPVGAASTWLNALACCPPSFLSIIGSKACRSRYFFQLSANMLWCYYV